MHYETSRRFADSSILPPPVLSGVSVDNGELRLAQIDFFCFDFSDLSILMFTLNWITELCTWTPANNVAINNWSASIQHHNSNQQRHLLLGSILAIIKKKKLVASIQYPGLLLLQQIIPRIPCNF